MATRLRQSIAQLEDAFHEHAEADRLQSEETLRETRRPLHTRGGSRSSTSTARCAS